MVKLANFKEDSKSINLLVYDYGIAGKNGSRKLEIQVDSRDKVAKDGAGLTPDKAASLRLFPSPLGAMGSLISHSDC